jgi:hypothetical protein
MAFAFGVFAALHKALYLAGSPGSDRSSYSGIRSSTGRSGTE